MGILSEPGAVTFMSTHATLITTDAFKSAWLERMIEHNAASYKYYWLRAVFEEALLGNRQLSFERLAARMVASAWYPVLYYRLSLGASDKLADAVLHAQAVCGLASSASEREIVQVTESTTDASLKRRLKRLLDFVPYRLIRPFYADLVRREVQGGAPDAAINGLIARFNREDAAGAPYRFLPDGEGIELDSEWMAYFRDNRNVISGWLDMRLVSYLQARNPSVPAIPLKIRAPRMRELGPARRFWEEAISDHQFTEIYTRQPFVADMFEERGPLSIDHFIPWSFVLHDEAWNLVPMFRNVNSNKHDGLPPLDAYLRPLCEQQFDALLTVRERGGRHRAVYESYLAIDPNAMRYERTASALESFADAVSRAIIPLHQIARNQGFPMWDPAVEYGVVSL